MKVAIEINQKKMTKSFEEFEVYKKSVELLQELYQLVDEKISDEYALSNQMKRAALSVCNNIAEGSESISNKQFIRFLYMSKGSIAEVRNMLFILLKFNWIDKILYIDLKEKC